MRASTQPRQTEPPRICFGVLKRLYEIASRIVGPPSRDIPRVAAIEASRVIQWAGNKPYSRSCKLARPHVRLRKFQYQSGDTTKGMQTGSNRRSTAPVLPKPISPVI